MIFSIAHKNYAKTILALKLSDNVFILLLNVKMPTIVGILKFMSRTNSMLSSTQLYNLEAMFRTSLSDCIHLKSSSASEISNTRAHVD